MKSRSPYRFLKWITLFTLITVVMACVTPYPIHAEESKGKKKKRKAEPVVVEGQVKEKQKEASKSDGEQNGNRDDTQTHHSLDNTWLKNKYREEGDQGHHEDDLSRLNPASIYMFASKGNVDYLYAIADNKALLEQYHITTHARISHFMAQMAHESQGFTRLTENLDYSWKILLKLFKTYVKNEAQAKTLHRRPAKIANLVYGDRLGNRGGNDGWRYRGAGFIQLTGRDNWPRSWDRPLVLY
ncbi:hypothetical protein [Candidatus Entotheonella palauensis]|uniref:hypothetical protein n=1 Tax=Candidatus Entotheonella palauensis TaxID=93172 RepID=UPI000B7D6ED5|nr:hypothetical protein [Candidatus Entotheonella palauensis]